MNTHDMPISHDTRETDNTNRHVNRSLATTFGRSLSVGACLLLSAIIGLLWTNNASAQDFPLNGPGSWGLEITSNFPEVSTVAVGDITNNISLELSDLIRFEELPEEDIYSLWQVEPADAARILTPMPNYPAHAPIEIEFLRATTVTVRVRGYFDGEDPPVVPFGLDFNELIFTFNVQSSGNASPDGATQTNDPTLSTLSVNAQQSQTATNILCDTVRANATAAPGEQTRLLATCDSLELLDDPAQALERISAEELFAMGDALTMTADNQISNIQSRINTLRSRNSEQLDIKSLSIQLWDQNLSSVVLAASKDALSEHSRRHSNYRNTAGYRDFYVPEADTDVAAFSRVGSSGGGASQDAISDSALGFFASGTLSIGKVNGQGVQQDANIRTNALTLGADYRLDKHMVFGAAFGIVNDNTEFHADNGDMDMQGISLSAFGTWYEQDKGYADIILDIGRHTFDLSRRMNLPGQTTEFARGAANANRMAMSVNAGKTFQRGATEFGPVVRIALTRSSIDGFRESSSLANAGNALELDVRSHSMTSLRFSVGAELRHVINTSRAVLIPAARMDLEVENDTDKGVIAATFVNDPDGNTMNFIGAERDRTAMLLSIGTSATFRYGQSAFVFLENRTQDDHISQQRIRLGYRMHF